MTFWNLAEPKGKTESATLSIYGVIGRWMDVDEREFAHQMRAVQNSDLNIYVNSDGGSVFTAVTIYNILARHKGQITFYIDGIAASAATIITSVPNAKVIAPVGSMMMIHDPMLDPGGPVNANEMRKLADTLDKVGGSIVGVYEKKTGMDADGLASLMAEETYLTALEAVDYGFADEVGEQLDVAACLTRDNMTVNGLSLDPSRHTKMPDSWLNSPENNRESGQNPSRSAGKSEEKKEKKPMALDLEKLKAEHRDLYDQVVNIGAEASKTNVDEAVQNAVNAERERIQEIESMTMKGHEEIANKAKFSEPCSAEAFAVRLVKAEKQRKADFLSNRESDALEIEGVDNPAPENNRTDSEAAKDQEERENLRAAARNVANSRRHSSKRKEG